MTTPLDLPTLIAQLPHVAKIFQAEKAKPEMQQQLFGPLIREQVRKDQGKVQQVNKKEQTAPVDRDSKHHQPQQQAHAESKRKGKESDDDPDTGSSDPSPWSGNIINVKI